MIMLDFSSKTPASAASLATDSPLVEGEDIGSFSTLLQAFGDTKESSQPIVFFPEIQEQTSDDTIEENLLTLLQGEDGDVTLDDESQVLNSSLLSELGDDEIRNLIGDAKRYLKEQILSSDGFKRSEVDTLPTTLKGLLQAAQTYGIDISKISLEEVVIKDDTAENSLLSNLTKNISKKPLSKDTKESQELPKEPSEQNLQKEPKVSLKERALFKEKSALEISTQQMVDTKIANRTLGKETQNKKRSDDTLKMLLQGEKSSKSESVFLTSDFSRDSAKVIAPEIQKPGRDSLAALLLGEDAEASEPKDEKISSLQPLKADSFELKLNEAKQMIKYLSTDVKEAIDNYKAPFTRVKVQLNPQQLGEVEITVVQRGKNLHVNLSSNNSAINTLAMNAQELKTQLQNSGINNASLNFSNNSQSGEQNAQQQQNRQQAHNEYNYFENEEANEEIVSSLEIVVPNYA